MKTTIQYLRKFILVFMILGIASSHSFAQDDDNKGPILPETGDWSISFNAVPLLDFALNAVNIMDNTGSNAQHPGFTEGYNQVITGKYFIDESTAYRVRFGFNTSRDSETVFNSLTNVDGDLVDYENVTTEASSLIAVGMGYEKRKGRNRLQGFFGGEGLAGLQRSKESVDFGNEFSQQNNTPAGSQRQLETKDGTTTFFGVRGFIGVEYFFARKMSIGAEFGMGLTLANNGRGSVTEERFEDDGFGNMVSVEETIDGNSKSRTISTQMDDGSGMNMGLGSAALNLNFHF